MSNGHAGEAESRGSDPAGGVADDPVRLGHRRVVVGKIGAVGGGMNRVVVGGKVGGGGDGGENFVVVGSPAPIVVVVVVGAPTIVVTSIWTVFGIVFGTVLGAVFGTVLESVFGGSKGPVMLGPAEPGLVVLAPFSTGATDLAVVAPVRVAVVDTPDFGVVVVAS